MKSSLSLFHRGEADLTGEPSTFVFFGISVVKLVFLL
jgi:hypothetical protein